MRKYNVKGMSCAACVARVEKAVNEVDGVISCAVSLLTNSMTVEGDVKDSIIIKAVIDAGYEAELVDDNSTNYEDQLKDEETPRLYKRLMMSLIILIFLMYLTMGHMIGLPMLLHGVVSGVIQMLLSLAIMFINRKFFVSGFKSAIHRAPNMDVLVAMGSGIAWIFSTIVLISGANEHLYFETAAMIPTLITIGKTLEAKSKGRTTDALKSLMRLAPQVATVIRDDKEITLRVDEVQIGDVFVVKSGQSVPVDGVVISGSASINEAMLTGESMPIDKKIGDQVSAGTISEDGFVKAKATKVGSDTTLAQIIKLVSDAAATKAPIAQIADKVAGVFVPVVLLIALVTTIIWLIVGVTIGEALSFGVAVLVISCPCSLGLATPVAIMVGSGVGAKNGILFKTAASLEETGRISIIALDKTGTITTGLPQVAATSLSNIDESEFYKYAFALENRSSHPIAKAIVAEAQKRDTELVEATDWTSHSSNGISGYVEGKEVFIGSIDFIASKVILNEANKQQANEYADQGYTPILMSVNGAYVGLMAIGDKIREDSKKAISDLKELGVQVVMLTGDNNNTAKAIGDESGITNVVAGVKPSGKEYVVCELMEHGVVAMVGDGINDAPALTRANIGIAIGAGTDVAIDSADVVLMGSSIKDVVNAIRLSRATLRNIKQNLFWAFFYNAICIPLAAGAYMASLGLKLNPMVGALCMSISSVCVVLNALRLNLINLDKCSCLRKNTNDINSVIESINNELKEKTTMTKTMKIEGMMCKHCEARVKKSLEAMDGVTEAVVSHESGTAVVSMNSEIANEALKATVEADGYTVIDIA